MKLPLVVVGAALAFSMCTPGAQKSASPANAFTEASFRTLHTHQDERNTRALLPYLSHADATLRQKAALAFASVQDTTANIHLHALLSDSDARVRQAAAYAVGQTGGSTAPQALQKALARETDPEVRATLLEAMGKTADQDALQQLLLAPTPDSVQQNGQAWGIYRAALRGITAANATENTVQRLQPSYPYHTRLAAAHTLARSPKLDLSPFQQQLAQALQTEKSAEIRATLAGALGNIKTGSQTQLLSNLSEKDPDYRVRLSALRSLNKNPGNTAAAAALKALADAHPHVRQTAAQYSVAHGPGNHTKPLADAAVKTSDWLTRVTLWQASLKHTAPENRHSLRQKIEQRYTQATNKYEKAHLLMALAEDMESFPMLTEIALANTDPVLGTYALEALLEQRKNKQFPVGLRPLFAELLQRITAAADVAQVGLVATALRDQNMKLAADFKDLTFLQTAQSKLQLPRDTETYLELQKTIAFTSGKPEPAPEKAPFSHPINWQLVQQIPEGQKVTITTSKGPFVLELLVNEAPGSVAAFAELVNSGFYNGKAFHRVVPNFVAQGGCPRGDGWGSTNYTLRSEFAPLRYQTGYVGLASAGKDTESCQWFITHTATPHLDGRYTIFARVVQGMDVVHQLQLGDVMQQVKLQ